MSTGLAIPKIPSKMTLEPVLTDQEFEELCAANSNLEIERTREGEIVVNVPAGSGSSAGNALITFQLMAWWETHRQGIVFDSSVGVFLPDGSSISPDAAFATAEQASTMKDEDFDHFLRFTPAFVIELRSKTDSLQKAKNTMKQWIANGAALGWLVDPYTRSVYIYEGGKAARVESQEKVEGTGPIQGFVLDASRIWRRSRGD